VQFYDIITAENVGNIIAFMGNKITYDVSQVESQVVTHNQYKFHSFHFFSEAFIDKTNCTNIFDADTVFERKLDKNHSVE
jgi:glycyl-tRNA synthetase (class II)